MAFVPSKAPWFVASPFGRVYPLASTAEVSKFATSDTVGLPRASNFNVMLGVSKSTRKDGTPTLYAAAGRGSCSAAVHCGGEVAVWAAAGVQIHFSPTTPVRVTV